MKNQDIKLLCVYCFDTLIAKLTNKQEPPDYPIEDKFTEYPIFVTWRL